MPPRNRQRPGSSSMLRLTPNPESTAPGQAAPVPAGQDVAHEGERSEPLVYLSARVPKSLRTELQMQAVREGRPVAQLMQDAVRSYLDSAAN